MQLQSISKQLPNSIPISMVREDIDALTTLLAVYPEVNVLRGQKVLFTASDPAYKDRKMEKISRAVDSIINFSRNFKTGNGVPASKWLTDERDKMRDPQYYD
ncbi:MAG: hypothetical protein Q7S14_03675 [bacterium]|nr:hypothetical protein [bacterium]